MATEPKPQAREPLESLAVLALTSSLDEESEQVGYAGLDSEQSGSSYI